MNDSNNPPPKADVEKLRGSNLQLEMCMKERTRELAQSQAMYQSIMKNLSVGVALINQQMKILQINPQMERWFSLPDPPGDRLCHRLFHKQDRICQDCPVVKCFADGQTHEAVIQHQVGTETRDFRIIACPVLNDRGKTLHVIELVEDVTERRREEQVLRDRLTKAEQLASDGRQEQLCELVGGSEVMNAVYRQIRSLSQSRQTVLLQGETGTGKELSARALHNLSPWRNKPFVAVNCGSLPETLLESELFGHAKDAFTGATAHKAGLFAAAQGGTIFLDEIETASIHTQIALLRVLDQREFMPIGSRQPQKIDVRVLVASNQELDVMIAAGTFREDLYYRISESVIQLPPLRERAEDIPLLTRRFFSENREDRLRRSLSPRALAVLTRLPWPGNVREFRNLIHTLSRTAPRPVIRPADLPDAYRAPDKTLPTLAEQEKALLQQALAHSNGNKADAARLLGISRNTVYSLIRKHAIR